MAPLSPILTDLSIGSDFVAPIRSQSIDATDSSSIDQFKITDLPLLALMTICGHLKPIADPIGDPFGLRRMHCKDLFKFRNTCRTFAHAVNSFFENPENLPIIENALFTFQNGMIEMNAGMLDVNYLMHPLRANRAVFKVDNDHIYGNTYAEANIDIDNVQDMKIASQSLFGPTRNLYVRFFEGSNEINKVSKLLHNFTFNALLCRGCNLTNEMGSLILALVRGKSNLYVNISCDRSNLTDAPAFLDQLYSSTRNLFLDQDDTSEPLFFGKSTEFWEHWLLQKLQEGCKIDCNGKEFTDQTDLFVSLRGERISNIKLIK